MPTYVYGCPGGHRVEIVHRMSDEPDVICEICGAVMHRIPQAVQHYRNPWYTLLDIADKRYVSWREKRRKGLLKG